MTDVNLDYLPPKFSQIHINLIDRWLNEYLRGEAPPNRLIIPYEPLGSVELESAWPETVDVVDLMLSDQRVDGDRVLYALPRDPASQTLMERLGRQARLYDAG